MPRYEEIGTIKYDNSNIKLIRRNRTDLVPNYATLSWRQSRKMNNNNNRRFYRENGAYWYLSIKQALEMLREARYAGFLDDLPEDPGKIVEKWIITPDNVNYSQLVEKVLVCGQHDNYWRNCGCIAVACIQSNHMWRKVMILNPEQKTATFRSLTNDSSYNMRYKNEYTADNWWLDQSMLDAHPSAFISWLEVLESISCNELNLNVGSDIEAETIEEFGFSKEGGVKEYFGKRYERDPKNRAEAIKYHKLICNACGFNFEKVYGDRGKNYIEVHHKMPIHSFDGQEQYVNPKTDLITVCSNCHRMIHRKADEVLSIEELREIITTNKAQNL